VRKCTYLTNVFLFHDYSYNSHKNKSLDPKNLQKPDSGKYIFCQKCAKSHKKRAFSHIFEYFWIFFFCYICDLYAINSLARYL